MNNKRSSALVINDFNDGDIVVCRITSELYKTKNDITIHDWKAAGLKLPSVVRVHKLATLEKIIVERVMGQADSSFSAHTAVLQKRGCSSS
jgi:mRNA interferase MazF